MRGVADANRQAGRQADAHARTHLVVREVKLEAAVLAHYGVFR